LEHHQEPGQITLLDLLNGDTVATGVTVRDWEGAIRTAGELLEQTGGITPQYTDAMIRMVRDVGPYIVIAPGIALAHARPEEGALRICVSLITLAKPIEFGNPYNDPVDIVVALAGRDDKSHIGVLAEIAKILEDDGSVDRIRRAGSKQELLQILAAAAPERSAGKKSRQAQKEEGKCCA
jgi:mannitol/fructose-specific phosphotransferase system IIA component (Ntr-type)